MNAGFYASYALLWALVVFQALVVVALLRQIAELKRYVEQGGLPASNQLPAGTPAPAFSALDLRTRQSFSLQSLNGQGGVLLFLSPDCTVCRGLADSLRAEGRDALPPILPVCEGDDKGCATFLERLGAEFPLLLDARQQVGGLFHVEGSPTAVVLDADQKIRAYGHPQDVRDLRELLRRSRSEEAPR